MYYGNLLCVFIKASCGKLSTKRGRSEMLRASRRRTGGSWQRNHKVLFTWIWLLITVWSGWGRSVTGFHLQSVGALLFTIENNFGEDFAALKIYFKEVFAFVAWRVDDVIINLSGGKRQSKRYFTFDLLFRLKNLLNEAIASKDCSKADLNFTHSKLIKISVFVAITEIIPHNNCWLSAA